MCHPAGTACERQPLGRDPAGAGHRDRNHAGPSRQIACRTHRSTSYSDIRPGTACERQPNGRDPAGVAPLSVPPFVHAAFTGVVASGPGFATWARGRSWPRSGRCWPTPPP